MRIKNLVYLSSFIFIFLGVLGFSSISSNAAGITNEQPPTPTVRINIRTSNMQGECSGTLVAPNKVLTASHCIIQAFENGIPKYLSGNFNNYSVINGKNVFTPAYSIIPTTTTKPTNLQEYYATSYITHPTTDAAILTLNENVVGVPVANITSDLPDFGTNLTTCGIRNKTTDKMAPILARTIEAYGKTFCGNSTVSKYGRAGISSTGTFRVLFPSDKKVANDDWFIRYAKYVDQVADRVVLSTPIQTMKGDSGSPVYKAGTKTLIGINRGGDYASDANGLNIFVPIFEIGHWMRYTGGINVPMNPVTPRDVNVTMPGPDTTTRHKIIVRANEDKAKLGTAVNAIKCGLPKNGCVQSFVKGKDKFAVYASNNTEAKIIKLTGSIGKYYKSIGWERSALGYPTTDEFTSDTAVWTQKFEGGAITYVRGKGTYQVKFNTAIGKYYLQYASRDRLYPVSNERCGLPEGGCVQSFYSVVSKKKIAVYSSKKGVFPVEIFNEVSKFWADAGWETSVFGYPTSGLVKQKDGSMYQDFEHAIILYKNGKITTVHQYRNTPSGYIARAFYQLKDEYKLDNPTGKLKCGLAGNGCVRSFTSKATGKTYAIYTFGSSYNYGIIDLGSVFYKEYAKSGWENGKLGYPIGKPKPQMDFAPSYSSQNFTKGFMTYDGKRVVISYFSDRLIAYIIADKYVPIREAKCGLKDNGCVQSAIDPKTGEEYAFYRHNQIVAAVKRNDPIGQYWIKLGWENSKLGYPITNIIKTSKGTMQRFQNGTIVNENGVVKVI